MARKRSRRASNTQPSNKSGKGWHESSEWEPEESRPQTFFLDKNGGVGRLVSRKPEIGHDVRWTHDPRNPVPSTTSIEEIWYLLAAYPDERSLQQRKDVMTFTSEPLETSLAIAGRPFIRLEFSSTAPSAHLFAKLQDVAPDGTTRAISRNQAVTPGNSSELALPLSDIAYLFQRGHQIQLQLQSSDYPYYLVHPGTDENPWSADRLVASQQSITIGGGLAASLTLPVLPSNGQT